MGVFDPDDFSGRPYVGGMNQALHHVFGSALVGWAKYCVTDDPWLCLAAACLAFTSWEVYQRIFKGATRPDFIADMCYWASGAVTWSVLISAEKINGVGVLYPVGVLMVWVVEYTRLNDNE